MNAEARTMKADRSPTAADGNPFLTRAQMAAMDFEPFVPLDLSVLPSDREWTSDTMPTIRLAYATLFKRKAELVAIFEADDGEMGAQLVEGINNLRKRLKATCELLATSEARLMCAAAVVMPENSEQANRA